MVCPGVAFDKLDLQNKYLLSGLLKEKLKERISAPKLRSAISTILHY